MTARLSAIEGDFTPGSDRLVYGIDTFRAEVDRVRKLAYDGWDNNKLVVAKLTEGQAPITKRHVDLAENTYAGAVDIVSMAIEAGKPWTVYHYATPNRNAKKYAPDVEAEAAHFLSMLERFEDHIFNLHADERAMRAARMLAQVGDDTDTHKALSAHLLGHNLCHRSRVWLDFEDKRSPLYLDKNWRGLTDWAAEWLAIVYAALEYRPAFYAFSDYCRHLAKPHALGAYPLVQAEYDNNRPGRVLEAPKMPHGWSSRAGWQFTSKYRHGLDRNVFRLSALAVPGRM